MSQLPLVSSLKRLIEKATMFYRKTLKRVFSLVALLFVLAFASIFFLIFALILTLMGVSSYDANPDLNGSISVQENSPINQSPTITDAETPKIDVQPIVATYKVSFYDANLDFNGSINVQAIARSVSLN
ncbi:MAG: hypothetical protein LBP89_09055 [Helicobacteraceae bacterium]|jgi:hypothetical protein|nr:hypothetical protein [Helicobacteraceae bacterium]